MNGDLFVQASQFGIKENEVHVATLNLDEVSAARANLTRTRLTHTTFHFKKIYVDFDACDPSNVFHLSVPITV